MAAEEVFTAVILRSDATKNLSFSQYPSPERFFAEFTPAPAGAQNDNPKAFFPSL